MPLDLPSQAAYMALVVCPSPAPRRTGFRRILGSAILLLPLVAGCAVGPVAPSTASPAATASPPPAIGSTGAAPAAGTPATPSSAPPLLLSPLSAGAPPAAWHSAHASSYGVGDGLLGGRLACGGRLTASVLAVATAGLGCGTTIQLRHGDASVTARVLDRRPAVHGITFYLAPAVCARLGDCSGDIVVSWRQP
jgi:hypothetical protein